MSLGASRATSTREFQLLHTFAITSTGSHSYTIPAGVRYIEIEMWGAGGGGGSHTHLGSPRSGTDHSGGGGGGSSYTSSSAPIGGSGGSGIVIVRWEVL